MKKLIILLITCFAANFAQEVGARYLIITHDSYYNILQPLVEWKKRKGLRTKIVKLSEIGSDSAQIRNYVVHAYNTWQIKPEYLLLVGNRNQLPFPLMNHAYVCHSDNYYTNVTGDFHNEIIPGRLWVYDTLEAKTVITKVLGYEKDPYLDDSLWFKKGVTIVNEDPMPPYSDSVYWFDARYMHSLMSTAGFVHLDSLSRILGHTSFDVINTINDGRSYILYRGIGGSVWSPPFDYIFPQDMHNGFRTPIVLSGTCRTVDGIGYEWLSAGTSEEPKGVVGFFGTTTMLGGAAEMRSALTQGTLRSIFCDSLSTLGKAAESGRLQYYELFFDSLEYDSWTCLGDPEMSVWTTTPRQIDVLYDSIIWVSTASGTVSVNVQCNSVPVESALVCIMTKKDTTIYHHGRTNDLGNIIFIDTFQIPADTLLITVTGRNLKPYCGTAFVKFTGGPYVLLNSFVLSDSIGGNDDSIANPGEDIEIPVCLKNWGDSIAQGVLAVVQKTHFDSFFTLSDTIKHFGDILPSDSTFTSQDGYNVIIAPGCPDSHQIELQLVISDTNATTWICGFHFTVHAPILFYNDYYFPGFVKSTPIGDTNQLFIEIENRGSYQAENTIGKISSTDSLLVILDSISYFGRIPSDSVGSNQGDPFIIATSPQTPACYPLDIELEIFAGVYRDTFDFTIYIGQKDYLIWDKDPNHSSGPIIRALLDSLNFYGEYRQTDIPYGYLSLYKSLYICSGIYPQNYTVKDTSRAGLEIEEYLEVSRGKVYLEGGDVWYADPHYYHGYLFHPLFCIDARANGVGPFPGVSGADSTFTQLMNFIYSGESNSIDRIDPDSNGVLVFKSTFNDAGCGVAAQNRTVGLSFELGGLVDSIEPSTKLALVDSIMQYFGIHPTGVKEHALNDNVRQFVLEIFPNPSRGRVNIRYCAGHVTHAGLKIYDATGRLVKDFSRSTPIAQGPTILHWDGNDDSARKVAAGIYFLQLRTPNKTLTRKIIKLR